jgi:hypothetical protein
MVQKNKQKRDYHVTTTTRGLVYKERQGVENDSIQQEDNLQWPSQSDNRETKAKGH